MIPPLEKHMIICDALFDDIFNCENAIFNKLSGHFSEGRTPYLHVVTLPDGCTVTFKFVDTIKFLLDAKLQRRPDRRSYLSYLEVTIQNPAEKAVSRAFDVKLIPIKAPVDHAAIKHEEHLSKLVDFALKFNIDLSNRERWSVVYDENYKNLAKKREK